MVECGQWASEISLKLTEIIYPKNNEVNPKETPTTPFQKGSLNPNELVNFNLQKQTKNLLEYSTTVFTKNENWECGYHVTMNLFDGKCNFLKIERDHCAGGVQYPASKK